MIKNWSRCDKKMQSGSQSIAHSFINSFFKFQSSFMVLKRPLLKMQRNNYRVNRTIFLIGYFRIQI